MLYNGSTRALKGPGILLVRIHVLSDVNFSTTIRPRAPISIASWAGRSSYLHCAETNILEDHTPLKDLKATVKPYTSANLQARSVLCRKRLQRSASTMATTDRDILPETYALDSLQSPPHCSYRSRSSLPIQ